MPPLILAIDVGTTGVRALVFDAGSVLRGSAYEELVPLYPRPGWVESDASALWAATRRVIAAAIENAGAPPTGIGAIGVANQRSTTVVWNRRTGTPLHHAIVWQDLRTAERVEQLLQQGIFSNTMASATKLEWLLRSVPDAAAQAARGDLCFGTIDTWVVWNLTRGAQHVTDHSNASCTGLYEFGAGTWDAAVLEVLDIPQSMLPEIRSSSAVYGASDPGACGLRAPVAAIAGDQQAAMFGQLRAQRGDVKITFGTSAMIDVNTGDLPVLPSQGTYPLVLWALDAQRLFCLEGTVVTAGAAIQWLRDGLGIVSRAEETGMLAAQVADSGGVWAVPAFQGLGTPYMDGTARAVLGGLSRASTKAHVARAVLEGIAFRCREILATLMEAVGGGLPAVLRVDGGAAANDFLLQFLADVLGTVVERPATVQATGLGAAYLAGLAIGVWGSIDDLRDAWRLGARFEPRWTGDERDRRFEDWRRAIAAAQRGAGTG